MSPTPSFSPCCLDPRGCRPCGCQKAELRCAPPCGDPPCRRDCVPRPPRARPISPVVYALRVFHPEQKKTSRVDPRSDGFGELRRDPSHATAGQGNSGDSRRRRRPEPPAPSDPESTAAIRLNPHRIQTVRSRSDDPDPKIPVRPVPFAKETLLFLDFNPRS